MFSVRCCLYLLPYVIASADSKKRTALFHLPFVCFVVSFSIRKEEEEEKNEIKTMHSALNRKTQQSQNCDWICCMPIWKITYSKCIEHKRFCERKKEKKAIERPVLWYSMVVWCVLCIALKTSDQQYETIVEQKKCWHFEKRKSINKRCIFTWKYKLTNYSSWIVNAWCIGTKEASKHV